MKFIFWIALIIGTGAISHTATLNATPSLIMSKAMDMMGEKGIPLHGFRLSPRITPQTQSIVRPSPDLAYSMCRFDLSEGPIIVRGARWEGYASLTVFDAATDAVFITSLNTKNNEPDSVILSADPDYRSDKTTPVIILKKPKGLVLIRRLAPTADLYEQARTLSQSDQCMAHQG